MQLLDLEQPKCKTLLYKPLQGMQCPVPCVALCWHNAVYRSECDRHMCTCMAATHAALLSSGAQASMPKVKANNRQ